MDATQILYPVFAMAALTFFVLFRMGWKRNQAVMQRRVPIKYYRTYDAGHEPEDIRVYTRHFINLFEAPVLFYVGVLMAYASQSVSPALVIIAWVYVGLRFLHCFIHLSYNNVQHRFLVYGISWLVMVLFYVVLLIRLLGA